MDVTIARRQHFLKDKQGPLTIGFAALLNGNSHGEQDYLAGITQAAADYGIQLILMADTVRPVMESRMTILPAFITKMQFMRPPLVDGMIIWADSLSDYLDDEKIRSLFTSLRQLPLIDIGYLGIPDVPSVRTDDRLALRFVIQHLVSAHGFSRFAFVGSRHKKAHLQRLACYRAELERLKLTCDERAIFLADDANTADIAAQIKLLLEQSCIQAIVTASDEIADAVIETLETYGVQVPDDIAVTGWGNHATGITARVPLTSIESAPYAVGYAAVERLIDCLMGQKVAAAPHLIKPALAVRQSCGCFEPTITAAYTEPSLSTPLTQELTAEEMAAHLHRLADTLFPHEADSVRTAFALALQDDITYTNITPPPKNSPPKTLVFFRTVFKNRHALRHKDRQWEETIFTLRHELLPVLSAEQRQRLETICTALHTAHATYLRYESQIRPSAHMTGITHLATALTGVESSTQLENALSFSLSEAGIQGMVLVLSPFLTKRVVPSNIAVIIPRRNKESTSTIPRTVREPHLMPKSVFPQGRKSIAALELLFHNGYYLGYAYLFFGREHTAVCEDVRALLSQTLYRLYRSEGKTKPHALIVTDRTALAQKVPLAASQKRERPGKLTAQDITDYLIDHLDELCDLDKMAAHFQMSKSHLTRRVKALTGYSAQTLHERLKIEQAKDFIAGGAMKMNDIAARLGYTNPNYFSNVFKKVTGLSPTAWADKYLPR